MKELEVRLNGKTIEDVNESTNFSLDGETRDGNVKGKKVVGFLSNIIKERTVSMK